MSGLRRLVRRPWTAAALILALTFTLPGSRLGDPVLLDSYSIRVKAQVLTWTELFRPDQTHVANPYYRPLFTLLHAGTDGLFGDSDLGLRLLALACHAFAALALVRFARELKLPPGSALAAALLFLLHPGNVVTAAWPVVAYWTLAGGLTLFAAADLLRFRECGCPRYAIRAFLAAVAALLCSETPYHLVAFVPLAGVILARTGRERLRLRLLVWPLFVALALTHLRFFERQAQSLATTAPIERVKLALASLPQYWRSTLVGDPEERAALFIAAASLLLIGLVRARRRPLFLLAFALAAPLPFAALGWNDRYGYFATAATGVAAAVGLRRGTARVAAWILPRSLPRRTRWLARVGAVAPLALAAALALQVPARLTLLRDVGADTRALVAGLDRHADTLDALALKDLATLAFVNTPNSLRWAVYHRLGFTRPEQIDQTPIRTRPWFCTKAGYFALAPADLSRDGFTHALVWDRGELLLRPASAPLGDRQPLPMVFLARGFEVVRPRADGSRALQQFHAGLLTRATELDDPLGQVLVEQPLPELAPPLPTERLSYRIAPLPASLELEQARQNMAAILPVELIVEVDVERPALLVAVTWLAASDPLHRLTGDVGRFSDLLMATLDGNEVPIVPAFVHGCGVVVPKGKHVIVLRQEIFRGRDIAAPGG